MLHFTCDLCGKDLPAAGDPRFVVKIEVYAAHDPTELTSADLDDDPLEEMSQLLEEMGEDLASVEAEPVYKRLRYDLCPACHKKFLRDPLNKEAAQKFDFSEN